MRKLARPRVSTARERQVLRLLRCELSVRPDVVLVFSRQEQHRFQLGWMDDAAECFVS